MKKNNEPEEIRNDADETDAQSNNEQQSPQYSEQSSYQQYQPAQAQYNYSRQKSGGRAKIGTGKMVFIILMLVFAFMLGSVTTAYLIMPLANGDFDDYLSKWLPQYKTVAEQEEDQEAPDTEPLETPSTAAAAEEEQQPPQTTDAAIGGEKPYIDQSQNPIVQIAQKVGPTVVGITISAKQEVEGQDPLEVDLGYGTGFIVSQNGYVVTNNHVVQGGDSIRVMLVDGTEHQATLIGTDAASDLALIKIEATGLAVAAFGDSEVLRVGETVVAIGNPLGVNFAGSVTSGIVSALNRVISTGGYSQKYIQTDAAINPGNSGGPLLNIEGEVIGVNTLKTFLAGFDDAGVPIGTEGLGFAIPASTVIPIIEQLMTKGYVERPGIGISALVDLENEFNAVGSDGVTIVEIVKDGPADKAGLQVNDIITAIDGAPVLNIEELIIQIQKHEVGTMVDFTIWREGKTLTVKIEIGDLNKMK